MAEVVDTGAEYDTSKKALLYAQAGIQEYWALLIPTQELVVFREQTLKGYARQSRLKEAEAVTPLAASDTKIFVRDLLPRVSPTSSFRKVK